jgi:hypothetical protein
LASQGGRELVNGGYPADNENMLPPRGAPPNEHRDLWIRSFAMRLRQWVPRLDGEQCELFAEVAWSSFGELQPQHAAEVFARTGLTGETSV